MALNIIDFGNLEDQARYQPIPWTPAYISTFAWYDANDSSTLTDGDPNKIFQLDDKSGNGYHVSQSNTSNQPTLTTINGLTALSFNPNDDCLKRLSMGDVLLSTTGLIAVGVQQYGNLNFNNMWLMKDSARADEFSMRADQPVGDGLRCVWEVDSDRDLVYVTETSIDTPFVGAMRWNPDVNRVYVKINGTQTNENVNNGTSFSVDDIVLGQEANAVDSVVGEVVVIASNDADLEKKVEGYLAWKWGLQANLPSDHPYKNGAPTV
jgi:hypothetical protein